MKTTPAKHRYRKTTYESQIMYKKAMTDVKMNRTEESDAGTGSKVLPCIIIVKSLWELNSIIFWIYEHV